MDNGYTPSPSGPFGTPTTQTITSGQSKTQATTDAVILFDTSGGTTATLQLIAGTYKGEMLVLKHVAGTVAPTYIAPTDTNLVEPYTGLAADVPAGLVARSTISSPRAGVVLMWSGVYWLRAN